MTEPAYYLDLENSRNRATIESVKPGQTITVLVKAENNRSGPSVKATARLNKAGDTLYVVVDTLAGQQKFDLSWRDLRQDLARYRE